MKIWRYLIGVIITVGCGPIPAPKPPVTPTYTDVVSSCGGAVGPLAGAEVVLAGVTQQASEQGEARFTFPLTLTGPTAIIIRAPGLPDYTQPVTLQPRGQNICIGGTAAGTDISLPPFVNNHPLVGSLRIRPDLSMGDDTGPRSPLFYSQFTLLRRWANNPDHAKLLIQQYAQHGYQGVLLFRRFGAPGGVITGQHEVSPQMALAVWPDVARFLRANGLKAILSDAPDGGGGDPCQRDTEFTREFIAETHGLGLDDVIAAWVQWNEPPVNGYGFPDMATLEACGQQLNTLVKTGLSPSPLVSIGSFIEDPAPNLRGNDDFIENHLSVNNENQIHHIIAAYRGGRDPYTGSHASDKPYIQTEPRGMNGVLPGTMQATTPTTDLNLLIVAYLAMKVAGQPAVVFNGTSVVGGVDGMNPWDAPGFVEIPPVWNLLPDDIGSWPSIEYQGNGSIWWISPDGAKGATVMVEGWDTTPPNTKTITHWQRFGAGGVQAEGAGDPVWPVGYGAGVVVVEWH